MSAFTNLPFRWKIALPLLLLALLLLATSWLGIQAIGQLTSASSQLTQRHLPAISLLLNADRDLYQAFVAERSLLDEASAAQTNELKNQHRDNIQQAYDRVHQFAALQPSEQALRLVGRFDQAMEQWKKVTQNVISLTNTDRAAASALSYGDSERLFEAMRDPIDQLGELEDQHANELGSQATAQGQQRSQQQAVLSGAGLLLCGLLVAFFPPLVTRPLDNLLQRIRQIAEGDGDLRTRLEVHSHDELGQLGTAFNQFLNRLQGLVQEVGQATAQVTDAAQVLGEMVSTNDQLISGEHAAVDQVSTAATQMSAAVHEVARNAHDVADAASGAEQQTQAGAQVVSTTIQMIRQLAHEVEAASSTIAELEEDTAQIGAVLEVIKAIAEQTNLLALNAAIEAARAGEQGRGFAVVADEVRALAARTQDSTKDIHQRIERLQMGVQNAVKAMHNGSLRAQASVDQAAGVDEALATSSSAVSRINNMAAQIAAACEQQSSVTEEISRNITDIRDLSSKAAQTSEQGSQASTRLSELAGRLTQLVGRFRV